MISISQKTQKSKFYILLLIIALCTSSVPIFAYAQTPQQLGLSLSVTPTLFEMSAAPSQVWDSAVKVINNNPYELTVYASVVNFAPQGETGEGKFVPVFEEVTNGSTLAEWITISDAPLVIPPEKSMQIPVRVEVPPDATPGGHFAAILVGTRPLDADASFQVRTSQLVSSLFFVRIAGDVEENASIREFRIARTFVDSPEATFEVRFENKGNVHIQPQGEIVITNMWGKERGIIPINHQTHFGNVLPQSIRKFEFTWKGEQSFSDIGLYKAALTLSYGEGNKQFLTSNAYFYVIPVKALLVLLGSLLIIVLLVRWMIKAYVRRMLLLAGVEPGSHSVQRSRGFEQEGDVRVVKASVKAPVEQGVADLNTRLRGASAWNDKLRVIVGFIVAYRVFFACVLFLGLTSYAVYAFFAEVMTDTRDYEVVIENPDAAVQLSSEEILYDRSDKTTQEAPEAANQGYELVLTNSSDTPGKAAELQSLLEGQGYRIDDLKSDFGESKARTVIVYHTDVQDEALKLSKLLNNALLSAQTNTPEDRPNITIYIGNDRVE